MSQGYLSSPLSGSTTNVARFFVAFNNTLSLSTDLPSIKVNGLIYDSSTVRLDFVRTSIVVQASGFFLEIFNIANVGWSVQTVVNYTIIAQGI